MEVKKKEDFAHPYYYYSYLYEKLLTCDDSTWRNYYVLYSQHSEPPRDDPELFYWNLFLAIIHDDTIIRSARTTLRYEDWRNLPCYYQAGLEKRIQFAYQDYMISLHQERNGELKELNRQFSSLLTEITYQPGSHEYDKAKEHFENNKTF